MLRPPPPEPASLAGFPGCPIGETSLFRLWRARGSSPRPEPWWFSSKLGPAGGRFDLPEPMGTMYTSTSRVGALLEGLQAVLTNLPIEELAVRRLATITPPPGAPDAADLCATTAAGSGVTSAVWAGGDRALTQQWAEAFRRDGWWALHGGAHHDPSATLRVVAVFGAAGKKAPALGGVWSWTDRSVHDDPAVVEELSRWGIAVRGPGELPFVEHPEPTTP